MGRVKVDYASERIESSILEMVAGRVVSGICETDPENLTTPSPDKAHCADFEFGTFFPETSTGVEVARSICADCAERDPCLKYALNRPENHGVWGGESERTRKRIRRLLRIQALSTELGSLSI